MRKITALLLALTMAFVLVGCGADPVYDDLLNFINVQMPGINEEYEQLTTEVGRWEILLDDAEIEKSISETLIPLVDSSIAKLSGIIPATEEVKAIKDKYVAAMETYREGFEIIAEACKTQDEATINKGTEKLEAAVEIINEYNKSLETLAEKHGATVEY